MRISIIREDNAVSIDNVSKEIDLSALDTTIHAIQWKGNRGHLERENNSVEKLTLADLPTYQWIIDTWNTTEIPVEVDETDFFLAITAAVEAFSEINKEVVEAIVKRNYNNLITAPYIRASDNAIIGVTLDSVKGIENNTGARAMLALRTLLQDCSDAGIPWFTTLRPTGGVTLPEFTNFFSNRGCTIITGQEQNFAYLVPSQAGTKKLEFSSIRKAIQKSIDEKAQELDFESGDKLMLYAGFNNPFNAIALQFGAWEASVWAKVNQVEAQVIAGTKPMPSVTQALASMPPYTKPT